MIVWNRILKFSGDCFVAHAVLFTRIICDLLLFLIKRPIYKCEFYECISREGSFFYVTAYVNSRRMECFTTQVEGL